MNMNPYPVLERILVGAGVLMILVAAPLILRLVKPNQFYGFRVPRTRNDERVWYLANAFVGKGMLVTGVLTVAAAIAADRPGITLNVYALICLAVLYASLFTTLALSFRYLKRL
jgi:uncharacterized membrane protein